MLDLTPGMMIWTWLTFFLFFGILYKTALKPLLNSINEREDGIRNNIEQAQKEREEAEILLEKHKKMIADAEAEAQKLIKEAQDLAQKARNETLDKSRDEANSIIEKAKQEIEKQKEDALAELKSEVVDIALVQQRKYWLNLWIKKSITRSLKSISIQCLNQ